MPVKFVFVLSPKTHFLDLAGPDQVFSEACFYKAPFLVEHCGYTEHNFTSSGLHFSALKHYSEVVVNPGDYIFIPGMDTHVLTDTDRVVLKDLCEWLRSAHARQVNVCSVCTGAFLLAMSGLLDGKPCTTHWKYTQRLQQHFPRLKVQENVLFTEKDGIFTSAGIASGIDLALHIVEREMGAYFANKIAREIVVYLRRDGSQAQQSIFLRYRNHLHSGVHAVQDWLVKNLDKKTTLGQLAALANMSTRNFTRVFKKETGITLGGFIALLRREKIRELLKKPDLSRHQVARQVGLTSERQVRRLVKSRFANH